MEAQIKTAPKKTASSESDFVANLYAAKDARKKLAWKASEDDAAYCASVAASYDF